MRIVFIVFALMAGAGLLLAQPITDPISISLSGIHQGNQNRLRWVPLNFKTWKHGISQGYVLERTTLVLNGVPLTLGQQINSKIVLLAQARPVPEAQWEAPSLSNPLMGVAAGMIYGDSLDVLVPGEADIAKIQNLTQERDNRFGFSLFAADQDYNVAVMMGVAYIDANITPNSTYMYNVKPYQPPSGVEIKQGFVEIKSQQTYSLPALTNPASERGNRTIILFWDRNDKFYSSYDVYRSPNGANNWTKLNQLPLISTEKPETASLTAMFRDSLSNNTAAFDYKIVGKSPFGLTGPELLMNNLKGMPPPLAAEISIQGATEQTGGVAVFWNFPDSLNNKITGFTILRAVNPDSAFVSIGTAQPFQRKFLDTTPKGVNYYQVSAIDINGYKMVTYPFLNQLKDDTPPSPPGKPQGGCNDLGKVSIHWPKSTSSDVMGYRVYMSNAPDGDYMQVTTDWINDTTFSHEVNLKTLSSKMYYAVRAIDFRQNQSGLSVAGEVLRADIVPPAKPMITEIKPLASGVKLSFEKSTSTDVARYQLQRMKADLPGWTTLFDLGASQTPAAYKDSTASKRANYRYRLLAVDAGGNESSSNLVDAKPLNDGLRDALLSLTGVKAPNGYIKLQFSSQKDPDLTGYTIFRALQDSTKRRSFAFTAFPVPPPPTSTSPEAVVTGNLIAYTYWDTDLDFSIPVNTSYSGGSTANNNAATQNQGNGQYGSSNSNPPQPPTKIYYWIQAKYADGTFSPLKGPVKVNLN